MPPRTYTIEGGDDASYGIAFGPVTVEEAGEAPKGAWGGPFLLVRVLEQLTIESDQVEFLAMTPRYLDDTLETIRERGGAVAVYRIRPGMLDDAKITIHSRNAHVVAVAGITPRV